MDAVIEVILCKTVVSHTGEGAYVIRSPHTTSIDIPISNVVNSLLDQGYFIKEVRLKKASLNNFGHG